MARQNYRQQQEPQQAPPSTNGNGGGNKPVQTWKYSLPGQGAGFIEAAAWCSQEQGQNGKPYDRWSISINRSYYDDEKKEWKRTNFLRPEQVGYAILALNQAFAFVCDSKAGNATS